MSGEPNRVVDNPKKMDFAKETTLRKDNVGADLKLDADQPLDKDETSPFVDDEDDLVCKINW